jgi:pilus assembly protein CpaC
MSLSKTYGHAFAAALLGIASLAALPAEAKELKGSGRTPNNTMLVKIDPGGGLMSERITVYLNKGAIVELPSDVRDVMVANPSIVDAMVRTKRRTYLLGKSVGQTNLFFLDASGKQILNLEVRVERDLVVLKDMLKKYLPTSRIEVAALNDKIILSGLVSSAAAADKARTLADKFIGDGKKTGDNVINMLSIEADEQVMLKVRVVEMQRSLAKQFGVSWDAYFSPDVETGIGETVIRSCSFRFRHRRN